MMSKPEHVYRIHPAIGMARVGNSEEYYLGPETMAGLPVDGEGSVSGGLPIQPGTEATTITSSELRDRDGAFKRQAARFKIYQYPKKDEESYPTGAGEEIKIGTSIGGKKVVDIIWTVHLANKKANNYVTENPHLKSAELLIAGYEQGNLPPLRNPDEGDDPNNAARIKKLVIDPGPRAIKGSSTDTVKFDKDTVSSFWEEGAGVKQLSNYPKSFPDDNFSKLFTPTGSIETLGELKTDKEGRLIVLGGYGRACAWDKEVNTPYPLEGFVDNDGWFDDTSDGPVSAVVVFNDHSIQKIHGAWVVSTDPSYAPQTLNVVSLWDDIYDSWIRKLRLSPEIFVHRFKDTYKPFFGEQLYPIFRSAALQRWNTNLPQLAINAHKAVGNIKATDHPSNTLLNGLAYIRNPNNPGEADVGAPLMPLSLGDNGQAFLSPSLTQYFFLTQWNNNDFIASPAPKLGPGEYLDKAVLVNCLGGRFSPGIDMTFIVRQPELYIEDWESSGSGPFRIHAKELDYNKAQSSQPFLSEGYVPLHSSLIGLEPGDTSKFMALPWHTDYNSCATHETNPNPLNSTTVYWSWPAQRPVAVYLAKDVRGEVLGTQRYSVRGEGTASTNPQTQGRYKDSLNMVKNWHKIGVVIEGSAIDDGTRYAKDQFLEVESQLDKPEVEPWPINATE